MSEATLAVTARSVTGKQGVKHLRQKGLVPGVLYGLSQDPELLEMNAKELLILLNTRGRNVVVNLAKGSGDPVKAFIYEIQHELRSGAISHVDLKRISLTEPIVVKVPIHLEGVAVGVKNEGGILEQAVHTLEVRCLPTAIPEAIKVDVSGLHLNEAIHVSNITHDAFEIVTDDAQTIVHIVAPRVLVSADAEGELEAGSKEPEVIGKKEEKED